MKYLNTYNEGFFDFFKKKKKEVKEDNFEHLQIKGLCEKYKIINYTINKDYSIDVDGDVNLHSLKLSEIPIKFNKVTGTFDCSYNMLKDLKNSPKWVGGNFLCQNQYYDSLVTLKGSPEYVKHLFICRDNEKLKSCQYMPKNTTYIDISYTGIASFDFIPNNIEIKHIQSTLSYIFEIFDKIPNYNSDKIDFYIELFKDFNVIEAPKEPTFKHIIIMDKLNDFLSTVFERDVTLKEVSEDLYNKIDTNYDLL